MSCYWILVASSSPLRLADRPRYALCRYIRFNLRFQICARRSRVMVRHRCLSTHLLLLLGLPPSTGVLPYLAMYVRQYQPDKIACRHTAEGLQTGSTPLNALRRTQPQSPRAGRGAGHHVLCEICTKWILFACRDGNRVEVA